MLQTCECKRTQLFFHLLWSMTHFQFHQVERLAKYLFRTKKRVIYENLCIKKLNVICSIAYNSSFRVEDIFLSYFIKRTTIKKREKILHKETLQDCW